MESRKLTLITAVMWFAALAIPGQLAAPEQTEGVTGANASTANPVPLINQPLVPEARKSGGSGFTLTVNGTGFVPGSVVKWNGSPRVDPFCFGFEVGCENPCLRYCKIQYGFGHGFRPQPGRWNV
jgi:hypothetical protein